MAGLDPGLALELQVAEAVSPKKGKVAGVMVAVQVNPRHPHLHRRHTSGFPWLWGPGRAGSGEPVSDTWSGRTHGSHLQRRPPSGAARGGSRKKPAVPPLRAARAEFLAELLLSEGWLPQLWKCVFGMETQTRS